jgi:single-stranded-DNA-specific exonuclease
MLPGPTKRWLINEVIQPIPPEVDQDLLGYQEKLPTFFRKILYYRGITNAAQADVFLNGAPSCASPYDLTGMKDAVSRLEWAIKNQEPIVVYGDYDTDGVTSTALLVQVLQQLNARVEAYIPSRFDEGYGLNIEAVEKLAAEGTRIIVTVDCGIRSIEEAKRAEQLGVDVIITDHHHPLAEIPQAYAVICPRQPQDVYPYKDLCGVGLAYKLAQALVECFPQSEIDVRDWLDFVAIGTVADIAPLTGENRLLVRQGLEQIHRSTRPGILALVGASGISSLSTVSTGDIGFRLAPRLNAAGRLETAQNSLRLLMATTSEEAGLVAQYLSNQNSQRHSLTVKIQEDSELLARQNDCQEILFAFSPDFSEGVVGLAASRLVDRYYRPSIVGKKEGEFTRASCRSIPEFHITRALDECKDLLERHGGHAMAAGFTIRTENLDLLISRLKEIACRELYVDDLRPTLYADVVIPLSKFEASHYVAMMQWLDRLQPTGEKNPEAVFVSRGLQVVSKNLVGADKQHLKLKLRDGSKTYDAIAFFKGSLYTTLGAEVDLMYTLEWNHYNGSRSLQLKVKDIKNTGTPDE